MTAVTLTQALRRNWPEYLIEAWALGMFMVSAGLFTVLLEAPGSPVPAALPDPDVRRVLAGVAMGLTAIALIYSRWGQRSGAHMNPAVTATFLMLGRIRGWDAAFYVIAQFAGGLAGVGLVAWLAGGAFTSPQVNYVATLPGRAGVGPAFAAEFGISALMMFTILTVTSHPRWAPYTGLCAGVLVACFIAFEAPLSGMSMNPARSFASAAPAGLWHHLWIYFVAPVLGMAAAAAARRLVVPRGALPCAKLVHPTHVRCIHCGHEPPRAVRPDQGRTVAARRIPGTGSGT
jgi:aquaporin Z